MENLINIGSKVDKKNITNLAEFITTIFKSASKYRISDNVIIEALNQYTKVFEVKNIEFSDCGFYAGSNSSNGNESLEKGEVMK